MRSLIRRIFPDPFVLVLLATVVLASVLPVRGDGVAMANMVASAAIFVLFFLNGVRLPRGEVIDGLAHWRLQGAILATCFVAMPLLGLGTALLAAPFVPPLLALGFVFLGVLPSTVQSATVASSMAGGNVAAAVVAAATLNLVGVVLSPLLFAALANAKGVALSGDVVLRIVLILLVPFLLGQAVQRWLRPLVLARRSLVVTLDRAAIAIAVYVAISAAVVGGVWDQLTGAELGIGGALCLILLGVATGGAAVAGRLLGLAPADRVTLMFSGTQKSVAVGAPLATILFVPDTAGVVLLPLLLYHLAQLFLAAWIAAPLARRVAASPAG